MVAFCSKDILLLSYIVLFFSVCISVDVDSGVIRGDAPGDTLQGVTPE